MKRIFTILILTSAALAQTPAAQDAAQPQATAPAAQPQTIKVRTGFDKKHKPVYATAEVHSGYLGRGTKGKGDPDYHWTGSTYMDLSPNFTTYMLLGKEATYGLADMNGTIKQDRQDVSYAVLGKKVWVLSPAELQAGTTDAAPVDLIGGAQPPMKNIDLMKKADAMDK